MESKTGKEIIGEGEKSQKTHQEELGEETEKTEDTGHEGEFGSKCRSVATGHKGRSFQEIFMRQNETEGTWAEDAHRFYGSNPKTCQLSSWLFMRIPTANHYR